jgi:hypothetical protein
MSWIEKELKRRAKGAETPSQPQASLVDEAERLQDLWARFQGANTALPGEIQLQVDRAKPFAKSAEEASVLEWLRSPKGAALGFAGNAIRDACPEKSPRKSKNFWIRWNAERQRYVVNQRISSSTPPSYAEFRFDENRVEYMIKCLVLGKRINPRAVRKKRFWLF